MNDSGKINGHVEIKSHSCPKRFVDDLRLIPKIEVSYPAGKYVEKLENLTYSSNADCNVFLNLENNIKIGDKLQLKLGFDVLDSNGNTLFYEVCNSELVVDSIPYYCKNEYVIDNDKETPTPSVEPSTTPSEKPSVAPSSKPSEKPSVAPSSKPSEKPSESFAPSSGPSTQPTGEIIIGNHSWYSLLEDISFDTYKSNDETITIKSNNATDKIEYFIKDTDVLETKALTVDALSKCEFKQYDKDNKPVISGKRNIVVYAKITSKNGEISYLCSDGFIFNNLKDALQWKHIDLKPGGDMHVELDSRELPKDIERDSIATLKILVCNEEGRIISTAGTDVGANTVINMLVYSPEFKEGFNGKLRIGYDIIKKDGTRYFYEIFTYDLSIKDENMNISNVNYMPKQEPSPEPSSTPSVEPSETATPTPSVEPSAEPDESETPSVEPGESVKPSPSPSPSVKPSTEPDESETPSVEPGESVKPSSSPSPSARPSEQPSEIPSISPSEFPNEDIVKGDVNGDNQVTLTDAQIVLKVALGITSLTDESVADVNGDKQVTLIDAQLVLKAALGIIKL